LIRRPFLRRIAEEIASWNKIVRDAGIAKEYGHAYRDRGVIQHDGGMPIPRDVDEERTVSARERRLPDRLDMAGRRVLVTGAASGIGQATAVCLAQLGATLLLTDVNPMDATREQVARHSAPCECVAGDMADEGFLQTLVASGPYFALACVAGVSRRREGMSDAEAFDYIMQVNLRAPMLLARACVGQMMARKEGYAVMVGSGAGRNGGSNAANSFDYATYAASKGGVHTLVRWLSRRAVGSNVLVNGVAPGPVQTAMSSGIGAAGLAAGTLPLGRRGTAEELGWPIALLCTPMASFTSGAILDVNGGAFIG
jgi:3-oxoacyl-[acyl-carrier protein] reductase